MQRYDSYKDSGIQWLGEIPSHWEVCKIKNVSQISSGSTPKSSIERYWGGGIKWITPADFKTDTKYVCKGMRDITEAGALSCSTKLIPKNSVVFSKRAPVGQVSITTDDLCINQGCIACIPNESIITPFFFYLLSCYKDEFESLSGGTTFKEIALNVFADFKISIPPLPEQQAIASYLDTATAKIDEAIAQQQKMIDLLNERKQIIINNAVTKGLNPNAKMKPSGIDWIGEIPEASIICKLKQYVDVTDGTHDTPKYVDIMTNTYPLVTSRCIIDGNIDFNLANHISEYDYKEIAKRSYVSKFDVIMPMIGTVGNPALVTTEDKFAIKNVALFRTQGNYQKGKLLLALLNSNIVKHQMSLYNKGGVQNFVSQEIIKNLIVIIPNNIQEIIEYIDIKCSEIDKALKNSIKQIALLQERKQIIINDVVTGKVKVCNN